MAIPGQRYAPPTTCVGVVGVGVVVGGGEDDGNGDGGGENGLAAFLPSATGWLSAFAREDTQCSTPPSAMVTCVG
jgi:hypothetical protein